MNGWMSHRTSYLPGSSGRAKDELVYGVRADDAFAPGDQAALPNGQRPPTATALKDRVAPPEKVRAAVAVELLKGRSLTTLSP